MLFNEEQMKTTDYSTFVSAADYFAKSYKLMYKKNNNAKMNVTVGVLGYPFEEQQYVLKKMGTPYELFTVTNKQNNYNIYYEKHIYVSTLDLIFPDVDKLSTIMNHHFERLLHYKVIKPERFKKTIKTQADIFKYCDMFNYPILSSFEWEKLKGAESHIHNGSNMCLYPTTDNKFMVALSLRLPIKKNTSLKLFALPQFDGSYLYAIRDVNSSKKNHLFLIEDMSSLFDYMETVIFENTHYTKKIRTALGSFTLDEYTEDTLKVYEMSKY